jgi:putative oxidoreductase
MLKKLLATSNEWQWTVLRLAAGIMILPHGLQKAFGMYGGRGFANQMDYFTGHEHIPVMFAFLAILAELLGGVGLILGFFTRIAAFGLFCNMIVGAIMVSLPNGFFMNWGGKQQGEGIEFHILAVAMAVVLISKGAGALSIDRAIAEKMKT